MEIDINIASQLIRNRRSIFPNMYSGEKVDDGIIEKMLENANWAPTHRFTEPWRFVVFKGSGLKKLADFQAERYKEKSAGNGDFDQVKYEKLQKKPLLCSHIIAIGMRRDPENRVPEIEEVCAVSCAVQNMWLTATAAGVGCYWSTGGTTFDEDAKPFFNLSEADKLLGFLYIGMPKTKWPNGRDRISMEEKVKWVE